MSNDPQAHIRPFTRSSSQTASSDSRPGSGSSGLSSLTSGSASDFDSDSYEALFAWDVSWSVAPEDITGLVTKLTTYPFDCGSVADVYKGVLKRSDTTKLVAIKIFRRMHTDHELLERTVKHLYEEAKTWGQLDHPNVLSFLGITRNLGPSPALVSSLCPNGAITQYLKRVQRTSHEILCMVMDVAEGLAYLHSKGVVHGNFSTKKVLVNDASVAVISGYESTKISQPGESSALIPPAVRFAAPEYFALDVNPPTFLRTAAGDVYAFSMVALEILSGLRPYHDLLTDHAVLLNVVRGSRPSPAGIVPQLITEELWNILTQLWNQHPNLRPCMADVRDQFHVLQGGPGVPAAHISPAADEENMALHDNNTRGEDNDSSSSGEESSFADPSFPELTLHDLKGRIVQDDSYPFACGGNSNLYRGKILRTSGKKSIRVAIKMIRATTEDETTHIQEILKKLRREAAVWSQLSHPNVLPFLGICNDVAPCPVLVSLFYKNGHIQKYLKRNPKADKPSMILGIASGLKYLHEQDIVHGDLKVQNILVDKTGQPCICDFGISKVIGSCGFTTQSVGTPPYMAPELFFVIDARDQPKKAPVTTKMSDVYSFGLLVLEILTLGPLRARPSHPIITSQTLANLHPARNDYPSISISIWSVLNDCWTFFPAQRPSISDLMLRLHNDVFLMTEYNQSNSNCSYNKHVKNLSLGSEEDDTNREAEVTNQTEARIHRHDTTRNIEGLGPLLSTTVPIKAQDRSLSISSLECKDSLPATTESPVLTNISSSSVKPPCSPYISPRQTSGPLLAPEAPIKVAEWSISPADSINEILAPEEEEETVTDGMTSRSTSTHKWRKRGVRKGKASATPTTPKDETLDTVIVSSQSLAREISRASRASSRHTDTWSTELNTRFVGSGSVLAPPVRPLPPQHTKKQNKWKLNFGKASSASLASDLGRVSPAEQTPPTTVSTAAQLHIQPSASANNVSTLIIGLNMPPAMSSVSPIIRKNRH